jgi:anti-anti-sigma factor
VEFTVDQRTAPGQPDVTLVAPSGEIDLATAPQLREGLERAEQKPGTGLVIDLRQVAFIDSTGIGELVGCHRRCRATGRGLAFVVPDGTIRKILGVTGMDAVFDLHHDVESAVESLSSVSTAPESDV